MKKLINFSMKRSTLNNIIGLELFKVATSLNKKDWILLKNGERAPVFLDTAKFISYPQLQKQISTLIFKIIKDNNIKFDKILGVPYGGLSFAYNLSAEKSIPCLAIRKEGIKKYSTSGEILGVYKNKEKVLVVEDATVTAKTVANFVKKIRKNNLVVSDVITILDVGGLAKNNLKKNKINLHALFTWSEIYNSYKKKNISSMSKDVVNFLDNFLLENIKQ